MSVEELKHQALALSEIERADLAHALLLSLNREPEERVEEAWNAEIERRVDLIERGLAKGRPAEDVFTDLYARLKSTDE